MAQKLAIVLAFGCGLLAGILLDFGSGARRAAAVVPPPLSAGDINGDRAVDIADAVSLLQFLFQGGPPPVGGCSAPVTTVFLTRHAEKEGGADPELTARGRERAEQLARLLGEVEIDLFIASPLRRTVETLLPLATAKGRSEADIVQLLAAGEVAASIQDLPPGSTAVVAHHSFTLHEILDALCVEGHAEIDFSGDSFENWLLVELPRGLPPKLHHLRYAEIPDAP